MNTRTRFAVVALAVAAAITGHASAQEATLTYKWTKGETLRYHLTQTTETTMSGLPGGMPDAMLSQVGDQVFTMTVENLAADGAVTLRQAFESVRMDITTPAGKISIDGTKPNANGAPPELAVQKIFGAMIGESFTVTLMPTGRVVKVEGFSRLMDKLFAVMPSDPQTAGAVQQMKASLSDDQMVATFGQGFTEFPAKALKAGDAWATTGTVPNPAFGPMTMSVALTLASLDASASSQVAKIATKVTLERDPKSPPAAGPMGMKVEMGAATGAGESVFDVAKGRLQRTTTTMTMPVTMSGTGPDGSAMSMKTSTKSTVVVELMEK
jgi:hypothetical protein